MSVITYLQTLVQSRLLLLLLLLLLQVDQLRVQ
jgi:hypothetical protein